MDNLEYNKDYLAEIGEHILNGCLKENAPVCRKGIIVEAGSLDFVKDNLDFPKLVASHKVCELAIDDSWTGWMMDSESNDNALEFWNRLVKVTNRIRDGLLVLNVSNIRMFELCWHLKQLAKQENDLKAWCSNDIFDMGNGFLNIDKLKEKTELMKYDGMSKEVIEEYVDAALKEAGTRKLHPSNVRFSGYVLIVLDGLKWTDVADYAKEHNAGQFDAMMQFYRFII